MSAECPFPASPGRLLDLLRREKLRVLYAHIPARFGVVNPDPEEPPEEAAP
jgi:hypothetical protein